MSVVASSILIVEDDPEIRRLVGDILRRENFDVTAVENGSEMDAALLRIAVDLIVLDLMLPGEDGLSICKRLRATLGTPILMLTAKSDEIDRVLGLELGADDYLTKPFSPRELLARVRAVLRRTKSRPEPAANRRLSFNKFIVDLDARTLDTADGETIALTSGEFDLLSCFVQRPRRVLTRDQILDWTHGRSSEPYDRTVDMLMSRLRKKLEAAGAGAGLITTVRNGGYILTAIVRQLS